MIYKMFMCHTDRHVYIIRFYKERHAGNNDSIQESVLV